MAKKYSIVEKNDKLWQQMKKRLTALDGIEARVGWFSGQNYGPENDNLPIAQVAQFNEEGTRGGQGNGSGIPSRPFIRTLFMSLKKSSSFRSYVASELRMYFAGQKTANKMMSALGNYVREEMRKSITEWTTPPNSPYTIAKKGFNDPLVETGLMGRSIAVRVLKEVKGRSAKR